jgi:predicted ATPase
MPQLKSITIQGYKSIRDLTEFEMHPLNVLIGANGAGKSNFINSFKLMDIAKATDLATQIQVNGGADAYLHNGRRTTEHLFLGHYWEDSSNVADFSPTVDNGFVVKSSALSYTKQPHTATYRVYHFHDTSASAKVKQIHGSNDNLVLKPDAANLAAYLRMLREKHFDYYQYIVKTIRLVAPYFVDFVYREDIGEYIGLEWFAKGQPDTPLKAHVLSDGTLRFICLATLLLQPPKLLPDTVLIDEPELGLHPYAIHVLGGIFKQVSETSQLIVATQSTELINELEPEDVIVVDREHEASTFTRLGQDNLNEWLEDYSLGELWKMNIFGGRP